MALYEIDAPSIDDFTQRSDDGRERVDVRQDGDYLEIAVRLPAEAFEPAAAVSLDTYCQVVEGVSHFLHLIERARRDLPTTQLELELQAEVDKFVVVSSAAVHSAALRVRDRLFDHIRFLHPEGTESGDRYRLAHHLASRFVTRIGAELARAPRGPLGSRTLHRFFHAGQREKIEMVLAA